VWIAIRFVEGGIVNIIASQPDLQRPSSKIEQTSAKLAYFLANLTPVFLSHVVEPVVKTPNTFQRLPWPWEIDPF
jgi:hypothetical protein